MQGGYKIGDGVLMHAVGCEARGNFLNEIPYNEGSRLIGGRRVLHGQIDGRPDAAALCDQKFELVGGGLNGLNAFNG